MSHFEKIRSHPIPALQASVEEYWAPASGARHIHLNTDSADMAFLVAFPTVPGASDGRAHILEHLALCGSQRYPVRDPFFAMMRRSTASFMNAFTYADRTVYPFASTSENDFFNLLDVYLDAAFFPQLKYLDFLQEGWRYTLQDGRLAYQGVVFNEMKGAFVDPQHALYRGVTAALLHGTTYAYDSGGDPLVIPDITHQMLKDFHATHYHPSQAVFMTAGPVQAERIQQHLRERVLEQLPGAYPRRVPQLAAASAMVQRNEVRVPSHEARDNEFGLQMTWLMGESADPEVAFQASLLSAGLLGDAAAPLTQAMETAGYGRPSSLNGHDDSARQMLFHLGMEGLTEAQVASAESLLWTTLEQVADTGVPHSTLQAALRDLKYRQRDTRSGAIPNVLERLLVALPVAMREGDVMDAFDSDSALQELERDIADPDYFKRLVCKLLESPARLVSKVVPDAGYFADRDAREQARLGERERVLNEEQRARIRADADALQVHQQQAVDTALLPRIRPADVSPSPRALQAIDRLEEGAYACSIASNGISYASVMFDVSTCPAADWPWLALYAELRGDLGIAGSSYAEAGAWRQRMVPSFNLQLQASQPASGELQLDLTFAASGLREEHAAIAEVLAAYIAQPRFDEHARLAYLIERKVENTLNSLGQAGHAYASLAAGKPFSKVRQFQDATRGAAALHFNAQLKQLAGTPDGLATIAATLARIHAGVLASRPAILCAGSGEDGHELAKRLAAAIPAPAAPAPAPTAALAQDAPLAPVNLALRAGGQVNHCYMAWQVPSIHHEDAAALSVAAELLTHQVLHTSLREIGGAYGGQAVYAGDVGVFTMETYRDPRLAGTYADFAEALERILATDYSDEQLEQAIISVIKNMDKSDSPWGAVRKAWELRRRGVDEAVRQRFRSGVLGCTQDAAKDSVRRWLRKDLAGRAAFVADSTSDLAGLEPLDLLPGEQKQG